MDTYQGRNADPITLHKYLYANANPVMYTDPSGYMSMVSVMSSISMQDVLVTTAVTGILLNTSLKADAAPQVRRDAKACAAKYSMKSISGKICGDLRMPILFHMTSRMPNITAHVATSQSMGSPTILSRTLVGKIPNRAFAMAKCKSGGALNIKTAGSTSCDEYPFASTNEGGFGATTQFVPFREQLIQGGTISSFYTACARLPDVPLYNEFVVIPVISAPKSFQCNYF